MTKEQRAKYVLATQGKAASFVSRIDDDELNTLASLCSEDGVLSDNLAAEFASWLKAFCEARKAATDESE